MFLADKLNKGGSLGGYQISRSLRFNSADSAYLNRTPASATNRRTWTWSGWIKRSSLVKTNELVLFACRPSAYTIFSIRHSSSANPDTILLEDNNGTNLRTTQVFRDVSAWYHIVLAVDTTQATSTDRVKLYVNGSQVTAFSATTYPTQNLDMQINTANAHGVGGYSFNTAETFDGYMTEVNFIDGTQLTPSSFGETNAQTGVWGPKAYSGSYGANGFYLNFSDNSNTTAATLGKDYSGNGNNWTPNNFSVTAGAGNDSLVDSPTSYGTDTGVGGTVRGNYCTWNAILQTLGGTASTYTNGNLVASSSNSNWVLGTIRINDAKYYFELVPDSAASGLYLGINSTTDVRIAAYSGGIEASPGGGSNQGSLASWSNGDIIGVAVDGPNKTVQFYRNGSTYGTLVTYTTALDLWAFARNGGAGSSQVTANFGQRPFAYTAPSGFKALCTQNLPTPTIGATTATQAGKYFNPVLYTGSGYPGSPQSISGVGFQPDFTWVKRRSNPADHCLVDAVRGAGKALFSNATSGEDATAGYYVTAFNSDGFSVDLGSETNTVGNTYVAWNWKANGSGSTNTSGSITSTVSANTTSGFSVATYTGNGTTGTQVTVGHGLDVAPKMIIVKDRSNTNNWVVYTTILGSNKYLYLNLTDAAGSVGPYELSPTSSVFYIQGTETNASGHTYVAYSFAEISGYSKFGSWTGNGSSDGPFVYTGFKPAYILWKRTDSSAGGDWGIVDATRNPSNVVGEYLAADTSGAGATYSMLDMVSNGFKIRWSDTSTNASGGTYIFMAFASAPLKFSLAR
jgi:hypothetical protein